MFTGQRNHFEVLNESLGKAGKFDDRCCESVAVLAERLERLKKSYSCFEGVSFSSDVNDLSSKFCSIATA